MTSHVSQRLRINGRSLTACVDGRTNFFGIHFVTHKPNITHSGGNVIGLVLEGSCSFSLGSLPVASWLGKTSYSQVGQAARGGLGELVHVLLPESVELVIDGTVLDSEVVAKHCVSTIIEVDLEEMGLLLVVPAGCGISGCGTFLVPMSKSVTFSASCSLFEFSNADLVGPGLEGAVTTSLTITTSKITMLLELGGLRKRLAFLL